MTNIFARRKNVCIVYRIYVDGINKKNIINTFLHIFSYNHNFQMLFYQYYVCKKIFNLWSFKCNILFLIFIIIDKQKTFRKKKIIVQMLLKISVIKILFHGAVKLFDKLLRSKPCLPRLLMCNVRMLLIKTNSNLLYNRLQYLWHFREMYFYDLIDIYFRIEHINWKIRH